MFNQCFSRLSGKTHPPIGPAHPIAQRGGMPARCQIELDAAEKNPVLTPLDGGLTKMTVTADAEGASAFLIGNIVKPKLVKGVPEWMHTFQRALGESAPTTS